VKAYDHGGNIEFKIIGSDVFREGGFATTTGGIYDAVLHVQYNDDSIGPYTAFRSYKNGKVDTSAMKFFPDSEGPLAVPKEVVTFLDSLLEPLKILSEMQDIHKAAETLDKIISSYQSARSGKQN
jgi:hypothetical protein